MPRLFVVAAALCLSIPPAHAQWDGGWAVPTFETSTAIANSVLASEVALESVRKRETAASPPTKVPLGSSGTGQTANSLLQHATDYSTTPELSRRVQRDFLARVAKQDSSAADAISTQMRQHDFGAVYKAIVTPFGLKRGDLADAITAYTVLGWMVANGGAEPSRRQIAAVRQQVATEIASDPQFANPAKRAELGEELAILFVVMHAGWQSAQREGKVQQYSDGVHAMFVKQTDKNLRTLVLTDAGFRSRG